MSEHAYHVQAVALGTIAGITTLAGAALLIYRRRTRGPVFMATTVNDKVMYVVLVLAIVAGLYATALGSGVVGEAYNYRESVSVWFRSIWVLQPRGGGRTGRLSLATPRVVTSLREHGPVCGFIRDTPGRAYDAAQSRLCSVSPSITRTWIRGPARVRTGSGGL
jgi:hypothetical protein